MYEPEGIYPRHDHVLQYNHYLSIVTPTLSITAFLPPLNVSATQTLAVL